MSDGDERIDRGSGASNISGMTDGPLPPGPLHLLELEAESGPE
jgi:hypothetical protein